MIPKHINPNRSIIKSKKGFLPTPVDILSIVLLGLVLVVSYFYFTTTFSISESSFNTELDEIEVFRTSPNIINIAYTTSFTNEHGNNAIKTNCEGLYPNNLYEVYFLEKHCFNFNYYRLVRNEVASHLRNKFSEDAYLQRYMQTIQNKLGICYQFTLIIEDVNVRRHVSMGNSIIPLPDSTRGLNQIGFIGVCSSSPDSQFNPEIPA